MNQNIIPIFLTSDDNYIPYLCVAVKSIIDNCNPELTYKVHILNNGLTQANMDKVKTFETDFLTVEFNNVTEQIKPYKAAMDKALRDYYSDAIFYRIFIPKLFPQYHKAIYIDCDVVVLTDIAKLFNTDLQGNYLASVLDEVAPSVPVLIDYVENAVGIPINQYFCSGVDLFDLDAMRVHQVEEKFIALLMTYNFETVAPDQDYLNVICKDHVLYLHAGWDKQANPTPYNDDIYLVHYNMFMKPWLYFNVPYEEYFWHYAKETPFYQDLLKMREKYTQAQREADAIGAQKMGETCAAILTKPNTFKKILANTTIDEVLAKYKK